jgi:lysophospholipase
MASNEPTGEQNISDGATDSRVLIIMTGGTICMRPSPEGLIPAKGFLDAGMAPRPSFNDGSAPGSLKAFPEHDGPAISLKSLRTPRSRYGRHVRFSVLEFEELLDSSSIDSKGWTQIANTIYKNYTLFDGFVVLHGTDSLAYTSSALSFMLSNLGKPVILTGSQAPIFQLQNDATDNLLGSLIVAGHFLIPEVGLFFNHRLFRGNRSTKVSADQFAAFSAPNFPPLATITSSDIHVAWNAIYRPHEIKPFSIQTSLETAHVACLRIFPGIKPEMIDAVLRVSGLRGLILETFGAGNAPGGPDNMLIKIFSDAVQRGIVIVNVTQCLTGSVSPLYAPAMVLGRAGIVPGHDLTTEAALTKLSYLLGLPNISTAEVTRLMSVSLRGELTSRTGAQQFSHLALAETEPEPAATRQTHLSKLSYAIASGDLALFREILTYEPEWLLNEADYSGSVPLHVAATGPNLEVLRLLLQKGASVHMRNKAGRTPLFLAANAGLLDRVELLRMSGAHLHPEESGVARVLCEKGSERAVRCWELAGVDVGGGEKV